MLGLQRAMHFAKEADEIIIPAGTKLYRSGVDVCKEGVSFCEDTEKTGLYFSTTPTLPIAMSFEYADKYGDAFIPHQLASYTVNKDILLFKGKYSYRILSGGTMNDFSLAPTENFNHIDTVDPIIPDQEHWTIHLFFYTYKNMEVFIGNHYDIQQIIRDDIIYDIDIEKIRTDIDRTISDAWNDMYESGIWDADDFIYLVSSVLDRRPFFMPFEDPNEIFGIIREKSEDLIETYESLINSNLQKNTC